MARFIGSIEDYEKFIGPRIRNVVQVIAKGERIKKDGICEFCGKKAELQSAHKHGNDRLSIIKQVLEKYFNGNYYDIDIEKCEKEIIESHKPIANIFYFLCPDCHRKYDSKEGTEKQKQKVLEVIVKKEESNDLSNDDIENKKKIEKSDALSILNKEYKLYLNNSNTIFSNINKSQPYYWFEIDNRLV